ncbi:MAG: zinc ribbon domain-containing protein [Candidatus Poribacteria bacterium]
MLNWKINSTVRRQIYEKVEYKASLAGIELSNPINPAFTSQFCLKCGKRGHHVKASDRLIREPKVEDGFIVLTVVTTPTEIMMIDDQYFDAYAAFWNTNFPSSKSTSIVSPSVNFPSNICIANGSRIAR